jgi:lipopolysaccharide transport system ATP-binding protein
MGDETAREMAHRRGRGCSVIATDSTRARISVRDLRKTYRMAESGGSSLSLLEALRHGPSGVSFREIRALDGVSLEISQGERVGIIGRNGAGKTTLLSILAGVSQRDQGTIDIDGDVHALLTIGAVLREEATGLENIRLDAAVHGTHGDEIEARIGAIVDFAELGAFIDRPVRTYSSGMKSRLAFAMAAFAEPDILIVDETLSVGDAFFSVKATTRMREMARGGRILLVVSHGLSSIVEMTDRCIWMDQGRIVMDGDPETVTAAYQKVVATADEAELAAKFGIIERPRQAKDFRFDSISAWQGDQEIGTVARAFIPLTLVLKGVNTRGPGGDLQLVVTRADGRRIAEMRLSEGGGTLGTGSFEVRLDFEPMILGVGLYRLEVAGLHGADRSDVLSKVLEVVDEEGQFGGQPLLFAPPRIDVFDKVGAGP